MLAFRLLAGLGAALVVAGWIAGWFARGDADVLGPLAVVRPDGVLGAGPLAWLVAAPLVLAPLVPYDRRRLAVAWPLALPGLLACVVVPTLRPRTAVAGETIGELVVARPLGQTLALTGAAIVTMALVAGWRQAPDWSVPPRWTRTDVAREVTKA